MLTEIFKLSYKSKWVLFFVILMVVLSSLGLYKGYNYVEHDPQFCQSCHIMEEPFQKWKGSPHHMVGCHECHKQSKLDSLHQVWMYVTKRPKEVVHHPELDHKVCAQCHMSNDTQWKLISETAGHKIHFQKAGIECLDCHMKGVHEFVRPVDVCTNCHSDKAEGKGKMGFVHCLQCHNFLAAGEDLKPTSNTCKNCHDRIQSQRPHPPFEKGMECIQCHKPHKMK